MVISISLFFELFIVFMRFYGNVSYAFTCYFFITGVLVEPQKINILFLYLKI